MIWSTKLTGYKLQHDVLTVALQRNTAHRRSYVRNVIENRSLQTQERTYGRRRFDVSSNTMHCVGQKITHHRQAFALHDMKAINVDMIHMLSTALLRRPPAW